MDQRTHFSHLDQKITNLDRIAILGASRGLGWSLYQRCLMQAPQACYFLTSRKIQNKASEVSDKTELVVQNFSEVPVKENFFDQLKKFKPTIIVYSAGGGPFGEFSSKKWSDHLWALNTTFLYPAELLHKVLAQQNDWSDLKQFVFVGSAIAESAADPNASSYAAAKHALKGLISSIKAEEASFARNMQIKLFSPGYMQTDMLPKNSKPVQQGLAADPQQVAQQLIEAIEKNNQR